MKTHLTLAFALLLIGAGAALAQTPDGLPPSLETVCDMETGAAYGHCNAYCEAMDCELANDSDPLTEPSASATACFKVRTKFEQTTGRGLPCEVTCPCADIAASDFAQVLAGVYPISACFTEPVWNTVDGIVLRSPGVTDSPGFSLEQSGQWYCGVVVPEYALPISPEQGEYCAQLLEQYANSQGVTCGPPEIDACDSDPCQNGGTCEAVGGGYTCTCTSGWTGVNCEEDINECELVPPVCQPGEVCVNYPGSYECYFF